MGVFSPGIQKKKKSVCICYTSYHFQDMKGPAPKHFKFTLSLILMS